MTDSMRITLLFREGECPEALFDAITKLGKRHCAGHLRAILYAHYDSSVISPVQRVIPTLPCSDTDMDQSMRDAFGDTLNLNN